MRENNNLKHIYVRGPNEILTLTSAFNEMVDNLFMQKEENKNLKTISYTDSLTTLYNHRYFYEYCGRLISHKDIGMTILFCDIDKFKVINDVKGHVVGDIILQGIAKIIKESISHIGAGFRYGGEEFVIVLPNINLKKSFKIAEDIREKISNSEVLKKYVKELPITVSIGLASYPENGTDIKTVIAKADKAMYYSKQKGRKQCHIYFSDISEYLDKKSFNYFKQEMLLDSAYSLVEAIDAKDSYTGKHSESVTKYAVLLADKLHLSKQDTAMVRIGALLHDCGKIGIPDDIINKPRKLSRKEYNIIKEHTKLGNNIVRHVITNSTVVSCIRNHHERWDGKGYPDRLSDTSIPLHARIICIADAYHAMISDRPYRKALTNDEAIKQLRFNKGTQFDPNLVDIFIQTIMNL
ncbi:MAG: diguanylate cyclase [Halanaerobiales bacterium]|nr:diguanylate cyclase [Halanaerobiales bacterium]